MIEVCKDWDEVELADVLEPLRGHLRLDDHGRVDVHATNRHLLLGGRSLGDFRLATEGDVATRLEELADAQAKARIGVVVLAGGLNTRGGGEFGPLRKLGPRTMLGHYLDRLRRSELGDAPVLVFCSPLNSAELEQAFQGNDDISAFYRGGLAPRLAEVQSPDGPLVAAPGGGWNPTGHFDALRWLVISGALECVWDVDVLLIHSLTNVGNFLRQAHEISRIVVDSGVLAAVEVTPRPLDKRSGSVLVVDECGCHRLLKYGYGPGQPAVRQSTHQLMSTNTWWFSMATLKRQLRAVHEDARTIIRAAQNGQQRENAKLLIDTCFPVAPILSTKRLEDRLVLQVERDLDQVSLLPVDLLPLVVDTERATTVKGDSDLEKPGVRELFGL